MLTFVAMQTVRMTGGLTNSGLIVPVDERIR
jgi:hypothetical protein